MSNNKSNPTKIDAKEIAKKYNKSGVVIFHFRGNEFGYASYGINEEHCEMMKRFAEVVYDKLIESNPNYKRE